MDSVNGINTAKATDVKTVENQKNGLDKNAFLQLLVTQMQYQDAQSLVGSYVIIKTQDSAGDDKYVSGLVDYVTMINNKPYFSINDNYYAYEDLDSVVDADYINSLDKDKDSKN